MLGCITLMYQIRVWPGLVLFCLETSSLTLVSSCISEIIRNYMCCSQLRKNWPWLMRTRYDVIQSLMSFILWAYRLPYTVNAGHKSQKLTRRNVFCERQRFSNIWSFIRKNRIRKTVITDKSLEHITKRIHCQGISSPLLEKSRQTRQGDFVF